MFSNLYNKIFNNSEEPIIEELMQEESMIEPSEEESMLYELMQEESMLGKSNPHEIPTFPHNPTSISQAELKQFIQNRVESRGVGVNSVDIAQLNPEQKRKVESKIKYLGAHMGYSEKVHNKTVTIPGLTVVFVTAYGSGLCYMEPFFDIPLEKKLEMFENPNSRASGMADLTKKHPYPQEHKYGSLDNYKLNIYTGIIPDMHVSLFPFKNNTQKWFKTGIFDYNDLEAYNVNTLRDWPRRNPSAKKDFVTDVVNMKMNSEIASHAVPGFFNRSVKDDYAEKYINHFYENRNKDVTPVKEIMKTTLGDMAKNKLLPKDGILIVFGCRQDQDDKNRGEELMELDSDPFANIPTGDLSDQCSNTNCIARVPTFYADAQQWGNIGNTNCKLSGKHCSICNNGKCVGCEESRSVILIEDDKTEAKCLMCFTPEEILTIGEEHFKFDMDTKTRNLSNTKKIKNPILSSCFINTQILQLCLLLFKENSSQHIFTSGINDRNLIDFLNLILSFKYCIGVSERMNYFIKSLNFSELTIDITPLLNFTLKKKKKKKTKKEEKEEEDNFKTKMSELNKLYVHYVSKRDERELDYREERKRESDRRAKKKALERKKRGYKPY
jgi:hypothetical protein